MDAYIGLIHKESDSDFGVSFPDFPGVVTAGRTLDEARIVAEEALALHADGMIEEGEELPEPSSLEKVMEDRENRDGVAVLIPLKNAATRARRINITVSEDVLGRVDAYAARHGMSRSGFLVQAAKRALEDAA
jgi:predicted RNase H-like HicB family nuclease